MFDIAFEVTGLWENSKDIPKAVLIAALEARLAAMKEEKNDSTEAFGCLDVFDEDDA